MEIYIVQKGDTIELIANKLNTTKERIVHDNGITYLQDLAIGQNVIITYPEQTYIVQEGDTIESIIEKFGITLMQLLRNNHFLSDRKNLIPGETLTISYETNGKITTHGFAYPYIIKDTLIKALPYLTYLSIFNFTIDKESNLINYGDDTDIIQTSIDYSVIPLMMITVFSNVGKVNLEEVYEILINEDLQNKLIDNILNSIRSRSYKGLNLVIYNINTSNQHLFIELSQKISKVMKDNGYLFFISFNLTIENIDGKVLYQKINYSAFIQISDSIVFIKILWSVYYGEPSPVISISSINTFLEYATEHIPTEKIAIGIPILGYEWELPYDPEKSHGNAVTVFTALSLAQQYDSIIHFDEDSQTPYFYYNDVTIGSAFSQHIVWYVNVSSGKGLTELVDKYKLSGTGVWNIMVFVPQLWALINTQYEIIKLLPENDSNIEKYYETTSLC